ncbi:MAG: hypothetical protein CMJ89_00070 [Planctomycetes bacterium]|nr:hypothetical protein [Planctomycetota bacterium]
METITICGRSITVTHVQTEASEYGAIQRYRIDVSGSDASTHLSKLSARTAVDASVLASVIDIELLLEYEGSADIGILRDPAIRQWRDENREQIQAELTRLRQEAEMLPAEPITDLERSLWRAFETDERQSND